MTNTRTLKVKPNTLMKRFLYSTYLRKWRKIIVDLSGRPATPESVEPIIEITLRTITFRKLDTPLNIRLDGYWAGTHVPSGRVRHLDDDAQHCTRGFVPDFDEAEYLSLLEQVSCPQSCTSQ